MEKSTIAVFAATGQQGGAFIKAALEDDKNSHFHIRAITRDPTSDKAKSLPPGVSVVQGDINNPESLKSALEGCQYAYLVTDFWQHCSGEKEKQQVRNFIEVAKTLNTFKHIVWSTIADSRKMIKPGELPFIEGNMYLPHWDGKGESDQYFLDAGLPTSFMRAGPYYENFLVFMKPTKDESDGKFQFSMPVFDNKDTVLPMISVLDIGKAAYRMIKAGDKYIGKTIALCTMKSTYPEMIGNIAKITGANVKFNPIPKAIYLANGGSQMIVNIFEFMTNHEKEVLAIWEDEATKELIPDRVPFDTWLEQNKEKFYQWK